MRCPSTFCRSSFNVLRGWSEGRTGYVPCIWFCAFFHWCVLGFGSGDGLRWQRGGFQGSGSEMEVTWEDQLNINKFSRLNNRFHELQDEIKIAKVLYTVIQNASFFGISSNTVIWCFIIQAPSVLTSWLAMVIWAVVDPFRNEERDAIKPRRTLADVLFRNRACSEGSLLPRIGETPGSKRLCALHPSQ